MFKKIILIVSCIALLIVFNVSAFASYGAYDLDAFENTWYFPQIQFEYEGFADSDDAYYYFGESLQPIKVPDEIALYDGVVYTYGSFVNEYNGVYLDVYRSVLSTRLGDDRALKYVYDTSGATADYLRINVKYENIVCHEKFDHVTYTIPSFTGGGYVTGWVYAYKVIDGHFQPDVIPFEYQPSFIEYDDINLYTTFKNSDLFDIDYTAYDFITVEFNYRSALYDYYMDIPFSVTVPDGASYDGCFRPIDQNDVVIVDNSIVIDDQFNFLEWLLNACESFLGCHLFKLGPVDVTIGGCMLVPLSLWITIMFLKKFNGG